MTRLKVLLVGLQSSAVDFSKWPQLTPDLLEKAFGEVIGELESLGFEAKWCLTDSGEAAGELLQTSIESFGPDIISIGAGIRADSELLLLFEKLMNLAHQLAPHSVFAFNTDPMDTIASVKRASESVNR